jgi:hypothetical protein
MSKTKQNPPSAGGWPWWLNLWVGLMAGAAAVAAVMLLRDQVGDRYAWPSTAPRVVLTNRPPWMSQALAQQIIDTVRPIGIHSVFDRQLLKETAADLRVNPWVRKIVQVRRAYVHGPGDTLAVDCDYRVPTALVRWGDDYCLVDGDGYALPAVYTQRQLQRVTVAPDGKLTLRIIEGVRHAPVRPGHPWPGGDLAAGLDLVKLLAGRPFAEQIPVVDVANFDGRRDANAAQVVLVTRFGTQIRWGRPPTAKDSFVEVSASQKLHDLAEIFDETHRVDGGQSWIDVRFDQVTSATAGAGSSDSAAHAATAAAN